MIPDPINALVMAVGSPLGQSIIKALGLSRLPVRVIAADCDKMSAGLYLNAIDCRVVLPRVKDPDYDYTLWRTIEKYGVHVIFPVIAPEFEFFNAHKADFEKEKIHVVSTDQEVVDRCNDKYEGMRFLQQQGMSVPDTIPCQPGQALDAFLKKVGFPVLIKPRYGASGRHVYVVRDGDQLMAFEKAFPPEYFVVQAFLGDGDEYTAGVYLAKNRAFRSVLVMKRQLEFGLSYKGEVVEDPAIGRYCIKLCEKMGLYYASNVQLKLSDGRPCAFEINPRLSSTTSVLATFGFNAPEMILCDVYGGLEEYHPTVSKRGRFMRYWEEVYLDTKT